MDHRSTLIGYYFVKALSTQSSFLSLRRLATSLTKYVTADKKSFMQNRWWLPIVLAKDSQNART
jgi:hypothetical protein